MEVKPGYTQTEVGIIPEEWHVRRFGDLCSVLRGGSPRPIQDYITDSADGINWIKIGDVDVGAKYIDKTAEKIIPAGALRSRHVRAGDFLLSNSMSFGRPYILRTEGCIHDGWLVIQGYESAFDTEYLYYHLSAEAVLTQYKRYAAGSGVLNLNKNVVSRIGVVVPPLPEQKAIAAALSDVDALLGALDRLIAKKRDLKQAAMQQLLTGQTRLPGFSGKWEKRRVSDMGEVLAGKALDVHGAGRHRPYLRTKNVLDGRIDIEDVLDMPMTDAEFERFRVRRGDVLLNEGQSLELVGRCSLYRDELPVPCAMQNQLLRFRAKPMVASSFAEQVFRCCQHDGTFASIATQTTSVAHLGSVRFGNLRLRWPLELEEQEAVGGVLSDMDAELTALEQRRNKTRLLKQGMMQELLTGRTRLV